jgi:hypothetical protein
VNKEVVKEKPKNKVVPSKSSFSAQGGKALPAKSYKK